MNLQQAIFQRAPIVILFLAIGPLILLHAPIWATGTLLLSCIAVSWREWERMLAIKQANPYRLALLTGLALSLFMERGYLNFVLSGSMLCCVASSVTILKNKNNPSWVAKLYGVSGTVGIWAASLLLLASPIALLFGVAWIMSIDAAGLIVGKLSGKTPLAPNISPQKTLEGAMAGLAASVLMTILWGQASPDFTLGHGALGALLVWLAAVVGDLVESRVKRTANMKDSGHCLPGHGGMADRLDSMMMAMPVVAWIML